MLCWSIYIISLCGGQWQCLIRVSYTKFAYENRSETGVKFWFSTPFTYCIFSTICVVSIIFILFLYAKYLDPNPQFCKSNNINNIYFRPVIYTTVYSTLYSMHVCRMTTIHREDCLLKISLHCFRLKAPYWIRYIETTGPVYTVQDILQYTK